MMRFAAPSARAAAQAAHAAQAAAAPAAPAAAAPAAAAPAPSEEDEVLQWVEFAAHEGSDSDDDLPDAPEDAEFDRDFMKLLDALRRNRPTATVEATGRSSHTPIKLAWKRAAVQLYKAKTEGVPNIFDGGANADTPPEDVEAEADAYREAQRLIFKKTAKKATIRRRSDLISWDEAVRKAEHEEDGVTGFRARGGGAPPKYPDLELRMRQWCLEKVTHGELVLRRTVEDKVKEISEQLGHAVPEDKWVMRFLHRNNFCFKKIQRMTTLTPDARDAALCRYYGYLDTVPSRQNLRFVLNFDEVPISVAGTMGNFSVLAQSGVPVSIHAAANDFKRAASAILTIAAQRTAAGWQMMNVPPALLLRTTTRRPLHTPQNLLVMRSSTGVVTTELIIQFIGWLLQSVLAVPNARLDETLIVLDSAAAHISKTTLAHLRSKGVHVAVIPGGLTQFTQPVDNGPARLFKHHMLATYVPWRSQNPAQKLKQVEALNLLIQNASDASAAMNMAEYPRLLEKMGCMGSANARPNGLPNFVFVRPVDPPTPPLQQQQAPARVAMRQTTLDRWLRPSQAANSSATTLSTGGSIELPIDIDSDSDEELE
jgi:hypothetical protein